MLYICDFRGDIFVYDFVIELKKNQIGFLNFMIGYDYYYSSNMLLKYKIK